MKDTAKRPSTHLKAPATRATAVQALAAFAMAEDAYAYGRLLVLGDKHLDRFLRTSEEPDGGMDDAVEAIVTDYQATYQHKGAPYVAVVAALENVSGLIEVPSHGEKHLTDLINSIRWDAMQGGFALGMAWALRIAGGAR